MEAQGRPIPPLRSLILDLPPSCIEFCPGHPEYFVVGTYNLQKGGEDLSAAAESSEEQQEATKSVQTRDGSLLLFKLTETNDIKHIQTVLYPSAILDIHFHPKREECAVLAVVSSTGTLSFFKLSNIEGPEISLKEIVTHKPLDVEEGTLFLSCSWHPHIPELLAITTSNHEVHVLHVDEYWNARQTCTEPVITHTLEAWTVAFSPLTPQNFQPSTIFSGGDDSKLFARKYAYNPKGDCDEDDSIETPYSAIAIRGHEAGVTAILPLDIQLSSFDSMVITGSYDDHVRVFAIYDHEVFLQKSGLLAEENLQGGVWRLKLINLEKPIEGNEEQQWRALILASCMHAGSRVLEITAGMAANSCEIRVLGRFEEHKSMNYGSDFQPGSEKGEGKLRCVSTSFYDKLLCLWEY